MSQWLVAGFSSDTLVSSTNKIDRHDIPEILLKVALNTIALTQEIMFLLSNIKDYIEETFISWHIWEVIRWQYNG